MTIIHEKQPTPLCDIQLFSHQIALTYALPRLVLFLSTAFVFTMLMMSAKPSFAQDNSAIVEAAPQGDIQILTDGVATTGDAGTVNNNIQSTMSEDTANTMQPYVRTSSLDAGNQRFDSATIPSSLFTYWEQAAIIEAMTSDGYARPTTYSEVSQGDVTLEERVKPPPEARYLTLGGIVYKSSKSWTIWLNGKKVTPKALPKEAVDLKVRKSYVEIKWFDEYTNQILPVRLRSNQRFNIDTRIFLPG